MREGFMAMLGLRRSCLIAVAVLLGAPQAYADSFIWKVRGAQNNVYLVGSMHLLPSSAYPLPEAMEQAYRNSLTVVFETDMATVSKQDTQVSLLNAGMYPEGQNLMNELHTTVLAPFAKTVQKLGLPVSMINRYRPWLAALTIEMSVYAKYRFKAELGVDRHFYEKAFAAEKEIIALETIEEQSEFFTGMSDKMSQDYLALTLESLDEIDFDPREVYEEWADGDDGDMEDYLEPAMDDYPAIYNRLIRNRNQKWLPTVLAMLKKKNDVFIVVGALHIPGDHGLLQLLENAGYDPEQL